ncbi:EAL domain-containing protein [Enterobacter bugandensis]|uniref:EAL domain-containing protein n=1 Tax=Enterobacter bugandensis TaxID=881260 RepID=UPI0022E5BE1D|nr:EAL domain-containing protein [Enterobacter bugandensis]
MPYSLKIKGGGWLLHVFIKLKSGQINTCLLACSGMLRLLAEEQSKISNCDSFAVLLYIFYWHSGVAIPGSKLEVKQADTRYTQSGEVKGDNMPAKQVHRIVLTLAIWLTITMAGALLTWYQVADSDLKKSASDAQKVVSSTERLLDKAHNAIDRARPLLTQPCTSKVSDGLSRLAIGIEHVRVINFFKQNILTCSSYGGADPVREFISADDGQTLILVTDDYISPGVPVMILRARYGDMSITASVATLLIADALKLSGSHRSLSLHIAEMELTASNHLVRNPLERKKLSIHSVRYPFSVVYSGEWRVPLPIFLHDGALSLLLSTLLGATVAIAIWQILFRRRTLYEELHEAVNNGEIVPWYQPIVEATTGRILGVEVLARWEKKDGTVLSPASFIPEAENSDLIIKLTRRLMEQAARELPLLLKGQPRWHIGFNVTQVHIQEIGFITECLSFIAAFPPESIILTIELTEREPFGRSEAFRAKLLRINTSGIAIALDDFGTGYANMEYLSEIPLDVIKIDRVFVSRIGQGPDAEQLLLSLINMAQGLNMEIVAEGVETEVQANWLREHGVGWLQGYYFSRPIPQSELAQMILQF